LEGEVGEGDAEVSEDNFGAGGERTESGEE